MSENEPKILKYVAKAGEMLRKDPGVKLADRPITLPSRHDDPLFEVALETLGNMINYSIERPPVEELPKHQFVSDGIKVLDMCEKAEQRFVSVVSRLKVTGLADKVNYQVIVDRNEQDPGKWDILGLRKRGRIPSPTEPPTSAPSVITFRDFAIDDVPYPKGSIVRLHLESDGPADSKYYEYNTPNPPRVVTADKVMRAGFLRLAHGFAGEPAKIDKYLERVKADLKRRGELV